MECPNIWIFTNWVPESYMLSQDRCKVWEVIDDELCVFDKTKMKTWNAEREFASFASLTARSAI